MLVWLPTLPLMPLSKLLLMPLLMPSVDTTANSTDVALMLKLPMLVQLLLHPLVPLFAV
jgi:hypothetical protein